MSGTACTGRSPIQLLLTLLPARGNRSEFTSYVLDSGMPKASTVGAHFEALPVIDTRKHAGVCMRASKSVPHSHCV